MKKKLYMHMGWPKTGSTTIQHFLYTNRHELLKQGICYPSSHVIDESVFNYKYENQIFACQCFHGDWNKFMKLRDWTFYRKQIIDEMLNVSCESNIISSEMFIYEHSDNIQYWQQNFDITTIYYLRNYFDWLASQQKEYIKYCLAPNVFSIDWDRNFPILACVNHHIRVLGEDNCLFLDFDEIKKDEGLLNNFMRLTGIKDGNFSHISNENITPTDAHHIFLYQMSFAPFDIDEFNVIKNSLKTMDLSVFGDFHSNTLPQNIYRLDEYAINALKRQGELLHDSDWLDKNLARAEELAKIPYRDLPPEIQFYILEHLSEEARELIFSWLPVAKNATPSKAFLPSMRDFYVHRDLILPLYIKYVDLMRQ